MPCPRTLGLAVVIVAGCSRHEAVTQPDAATVVTSSPLVATGERTGVRERGFSLVLPKGWVYRAPSTPDGADVYLSPDGSAQVTVSSFQTGPMDEAKKQQTLDGLLKRRRETEREGRGSSITMTEPRRSAVGDTIAARYEGTDPAARHRFATVVMVAPRGAWAFFLEADDRSSEAAFQLQADAILSSVQVGT